LRRRRARQGPAAWLAESERLFRDFVELTPYSFQPKYVKVIVCDYAADLLGSSIVKLK